MNYEFIQKFAKTLNSKQTRSIILCGNVNDLYFNGTDYVPLIPCLLDKMKSDNIIQIIYELNGPIRIESANGNKVLLEEAWCKLRTGRSIGEYAALKIKEKKLPDELTDLNQATLRCVGDLTAALETLRQLTIASRRFVKGFNLLIVIEAADMMLPAGGDLSTISDAKLARIAIVQDWFSDPEFMNGGDSVVLVAETQSSIHQKITKMPQVLAVRVPDPNAASREHFIDYFCEKNNKIIKMEWKSNKELAVATAGLSLHAMRQLLLESFYDGEVLSMNKVVVKTEAFIQSQLGEDTVEFKRPSHSMQDIVGFSTLKKFCADELMPRLRSSDTKTALSGVCVSGPIGSGKTYYWEAVAAEMGFVVLVLKNIRSQWYGQTDVAFELLRRVLESLEKVVIFVDEADTQFGSVTKGQADNQTETRLTGKIQSMMSDTKLKGKVVWLLMTARIHLLSPDIRRPGRADLIIPVLDPQGEDRKAFVKWAVGDTYEGSIDDVDFLLPKIYSAASFSALRSAIICANAKTVEAIHDLVHEIIPPDIEEERQYQLCQALLNCTRRSLLPDPSVDLAAARLEWKDTVYKLELKGIGR